MNPGKNSAPLENYMQNNVLIANSQRKYLIDTTRYATALDSVLTQLGVSGCELSVLLVNDRRMRELNRHYRGIRSTTDVLSFPMEDRIIPDRPYRLLGDIVISLERVVKQCKKPLGGLHPLTGTPKRELALVSIHGLLHLLGYDHESSTSNPEQMFQQQAQLFNLCWQKFPDIVQRGENRI